MLTPNQRTRTHTHTQCTHARTQLDQPAHEASCVAELRQHELVTAPVISAAEAQRTAPGGKGLALGLGRYTLHLPTLKGVRACVGPHSTHAPRANGLPFFKHNFSLFVVAQAP